MGPCLSEETRYSCLQCTLQFKKHIPRIREMTLNHSMRPNSLQISRCWGNLPRHHPFPPCSGRLNIPVSSRSLIHSFYCIHSFTVYIWGFTRAGVIAWTNGRQIRRPVTAFKETEIHKQAIPTKCETLDLQIQKAQSHHSSPRSKKKKSNSEISPGKWDCFDWFERQVTAKLRIWSSILYTSHPHSPQTRINLIPLS